MLSMIVSVFWVVCTALGLLIKILFFAATVEDVKKSQQRAERALWHLKNRNNGRAMAIVVSLLTVILMVTLWYFGILKIWVLIVEAVAWVISVIFLIVTLRWLRKQTEGKTLKYDFTS